MDWLGATERTGEAVFTAEVKRLRAELSRLRVAAGDAPADQTEVLTELRGLLVPLIRDVGHQIEQCRIKATLRRAGIGLLQP